LGCTSIGAADALGAINIAINAHAPSINQNIFFIVSPPLEKFALTLHKTKTDQEKTLVGPTTRSPQD
jgi:hypothetical protein